MHTPRKLTFGLVSLVAALGCHGMAIAAQGVQPALPAFTPKGVQGELVSLRMVDVDGVKVNLPTVRKPDGQVCVAYVASTERDAAGKVAVSVADSCTNATPQDQLLSLRVLDVGGVKLNLPVVQHADGRVCVAYVASSTRDASGKLDFTVDHYCDKGVEAPAGELTGWLGNKEKRPASLKALRAVQTGNLLVEVPEVR